MPTATGLADPTWKAANWDTAIVPAGEVNPSACTTANSFNALMTLPVAPDNPVVGAMTFTTLQIPDMASLADWADWTGPAFDRSSPQAFNAYLTPPVPNTYRPDLLIPANLSNQVHIYLPGYQDITDAQWRRDVWRGAAYDLNDSRAVGSCFASGRAGCGF